MMKEVIQKLSDYMRNLQILYVEDDLQVRTETTELLSDLCGCVETAINGLDGLNKYLGGRYDIIISDIRMPVMNGVEMVKRIKMIDNHQPIIITSAYDDAEYLIELINIGVDKFIIKPFEGERFFNVLLDLCEFMNRQREHNLCKIEQTRLICQREMTTSISHHWRQPLNAIGLIIQDIRDAYEFNELTSEYLNEITVQAMDILNRMSVTIDACRQFLKNQTEKVPLDLNDTIRQTLELFNQSDNKEKTLSTSFTPIHDITINGYPNQIIEAILHLLKYARTQVESGNGTTASADLKVVDEGEKAVITLILRNVIISDTLRNTLNEPYYSMRLDTRDSEIPLYMTKIIVEHNMGGRISLICNSNSATFRIVI